MTTAILRLRCMSSWLLPWLDEPPAARCVMILERKSCARVLRGWAKNSSGVLSSTIRPPAMNATRSAGHDIQDLGRAIAARRCLPPDNCAGYLSA
jgi:hypothetical protein